MEVVVAVGLDKDILVHDVVEANGTGAGGNIRLGQELLAVVDDLEDDWGAEVGVLLALGLQVREQGIHGAVQETARIPYLEYRISKFAMSLNFRMRRKSFGLKVLEINFS